ncbi:two-component regulator propeller domain-containing protein [Spirosoma soli]|uniref:Two-component regulator propeller domain-containing protein n=1 Tax=Spirosoma soli TaxID=1770529 RepID=A0ABW5M938_9BACT
MRLTSITQDRRGYIWLGGMGLYRFDGYRFKVYLHDPTNPNSLGGDKAEVVYCDRQGYIWIGLLGEGLDRLDPTTGTFTHYRHDPRNPTSLSHDEVTAILEDKSGQLWIGTHEGLNRMNRHTGQFARYQHDSDNPATLSNNQVRVLYEDRQGTLWIGTGSEWGQSSVDAGGLNRFEPTTQTFTRYLHQADNPHSLVNNKVRAIHEDRQGRFWVGTYGDGLHTMDRGSGQFTRYPYNELHPERLSRPFLKNKSNREADGVSFIQEDKQGALWIGAYKNGLNQYDPVRRLIKHWEAQPGQLNAFQENGPWAFFTSRDGVHWVTTFDGGLYRIVPTQSTIAFSTVGTTTHAFWQDNQGKFWIGTAKGLMCQDLQSGRVRWFRHDAAQPTSLGADDVREIYQDRQGTIWIGTKGAGLNRYHASTQTFSQYPHSKRSATSLITDNVHVIREDQNGKLWLGTTQGLDEFDPRTGYFIHHQHNPLDSTTLSDNGIPVLLLDHKGALWAGGYFKGGVNRYDQITNSFRRYLPGLRVTGMIEDQHGVIWAGGVGGLFRYDQTNDRFLPAMPNDPNSPVNITSLQLSNDNSLWISDLSGILQYNPGRNVTTRYGRLQGVNGRTMWEFSGYKTPNDQLYFGDRMGYYTFHPTQVKNQVWPAEVVLTDIRVNGQPRLVSFSSLPEGETTTYTKPQLILKHDENELSFAFAYLDYRSPELNRHQFKLENYDQHWHPSGPERTASYSHVPPGTYIFRVKGANNDVPWAEQQLTIVIHPPWWQTVWFRVSALLTGLIVVVLLVRYYTLYKLRRQRADLKRVLQAQEEERQRLAADLHDDLGATLATIKVQMETVPCSEHELRKFVSLMEKAIRDLRLISHNLMPPEFNKLGLTENLREVIRRLEVSDHTKFLFVTFGQERRLEAEAELVIYRIAIELINNALKHAKARTITIQLLFHPEMVSLMVEDDGLGSAAKASIEAGIGLRNVRSRANYLGADLMVDAGHKGTTITLTVPIAQRASTYGS